MAESSGCAIESPTVELVGAAELDCRQTSIRLYLFQLLRCRKAPILEPTHLKPGASQRRWRSRPSREAGRPKQPTGHPMFSRTGLQDFLSGAQSLMRKEPRLAAWLFSCVPSMNIGLEVEVLWEVGRNDPSERQGGNRERLAESSSERDLRGDEQESDSRRCR